MEKIEGEMRKICKEKLKLERFELPREEALKFMEEKGDPYRWSSSRSAGGRSHLPSIGRASSPRPAPAPI